MLDAEANRELFEEQVEIIMKAFREESFSHRGKHYTLPPHVPYRGYDLEEISLVPRPLHATECWQPVVSASPRGLDFMMKHRIKGLIGGGAATAAQKSIYAFQEAAHRAGCQAYLALLTFWESGSAVDDGDNAAHLSLAARQVGTFHWSDIGGWTPGLGRAGITHRASALNLAQRLQHLPGLRVEGVAAFEGRCLLVPDVEERAAEDRLAMERLTGVADVIDAGELPVRVRSGAALKHET